MSSFPFHRSRGREYRCAGPPKSRGASVSSQSLGLGNRRLQQHEQWPPAVPRRRSAAHTDLSAVARAVLLECGLSLCASPRHAPNIGRSVRIARPPVVNVWRSPNASLSCSFLQASSYQVAAAGAANPCPAAHVSTSFRGCRGTPRSGSAGSGLDLPLVGLRAIQHQPVIGCHRVARRAVVAPKRACIAGSRTCAVLTSSVSTNMVILHRSPYARRDRRAGFGSSPILVARTTDNRECLLFVRFGTSRPTVRWNRTVRRLASWFASVAPQPPCPVSLRSALTRLACCRAGAQVDDPRAGGSYPGR